MPSDPFASLPEKSRTPNSVRTIEQWINQANAAAKLDPSRSGWILASTVVIGALQSVLDKDDQPLFLLKGGVYLERRLGGATRATSDIDTLFRSDISTFENALDTAFERNWGPISFERTPFSRF